MGTINLGVYGPLVLAPAEGLWGPFDPLSSGGHLLWEMLYFFLT